NSFVVQRIDPNNGRSCSALRIFCRRAIIALLAIDFSSHQALRSFSASIRMTGAAARYAGSPAGWPYCAAGDRFAAHQVSWIPSAQR
ncbi:hypothetical protein ACTHQ2_25795, partial [Bacillus subtilis]|uniref:hypothetical protein n=1 Tax=Bacillus subtilis TaxID=1423 RepID=UPI003F7C739D